MVDHAIFDMCSFGSLVVRISHWVFSGMRRLSSNVARKFLKFYIADHMKTLLNSVVLHKRVCEDERNGLLFHDILDILRSSVLSIFMTWLGKGPFIVSVRLLSSYPELWGSERSLKKCITRLLRDGKVFA